MIAPRFHVLCLILAGAAATSVVPAQSPRSPGSPGPWGVLSTTPIRISPPAENLDHEPFISAATWRFATTAWSPVLKVLGSLELQPADKSALLDPAIRQTDPASGFLSLHVPDSVRWALTPADRETLYHLLATFEANEVHFLPTFVPPDVILDRARLNPRLRAGIRRLAFRRGDRDAVVDLDLLEPLADNNEELRRLKHAFYSSPSLNVELLRESVANADEVAAYWSPRGRAQPGAALRTLANSPRLASIDLVHLLPDLPQSVLNSYPGPSNPNCPPDANCFWFALNFFAREPDDRFLPVDRSSRDSMTATLEELRRNYVQVNGPLQFGDIVSFSIEHGDSFEPVHMAVYIADEIVMTKNGAGALSPFVFMKRKDCEQNYTWAAKLTVRAYRRR